MEWQAPSAERPKLNSHAAGGHTPWQERPVMGAVQAQTGISHRRRGPPQPAMGGEKRTAWSNILPYIVHRSESGAMTTDDSVVVIVDDDVRVREALCELLESH